MASPNQDAANQDGNMSNIHLGFGVELLYHHLDASNHGSQGLHETIEFQTPHYTQNPLSNPYIPCIFNFLGCARHFYLEELQEWTFHTSEHMKDLPFPVHPQLNHDTAGTLDSQHYDPNSSSFGLSHNQDQSSSLLPLDSQSQTISLDTTSNHRTPSNNPSCSQTNPEEAISQFEKSILPFSLFSQRKAAKLIAELKRLVVEEKEFGDTEDASAKVILESPASSFQDSSSTSEVMDTDNTSVSSSDPRPLTQGQVTSTPTSSKHRHRCEKCIYFCTRPDCDYATHSKIDWKRHEEGDKHWPQERYLCFHCPLPLPTTDFLGNLSCQFCHIPLPPGVDSRTHFLQCDIARENIKSFGRDDHFSKHLREKHSMNTRDRAQAVASWKYIIHSNWPRQCDFCEVRFQAWEERMQHLAEHFLAIFKAKPKGFRPPGFGVQRKDDDSDDDDDNSPFNDGKPICGQKRAARSSFQTQPKTSKSRHTQTNRMSTQGGTRRRSHGPTHLVEMKDELLTTSPPGRRTSLALERYLNDPDEPTPTTWKTSAHSQKTHFQCPVRISRPPRTLFGYETYEPQHLGRATAAKHSKDVGQELEAKARVPVSLMEIGELLKKIKKRYGLQDTIGIQSKVICLPLDNGKPHFHLKFVCQNSSAGPSIIFRIPSNEFVELTNALSTSIEFDKHSWDLCDQNGSQQTLHHIYHGSKMRPVKENTRRWSFHEMVKSREQYFAMLSRAYLDPAFSKAEASRSFGTKNEQARQSLKALGILSQFRGPRMSILGFARDQLPFRQLIGRTESIEGKCGSIIAFMGKSFAVQTQVPQKKTQSYSVTASGLFEEAVVLIDALRSLHDTPITPHTRFHMDLKPANILCSYVVHSELFKVSDFGMSSFAFNKKQIGGSISSRASARGKIQIWHYSALPQKNLSSQRISFQQQEKLYQKQILRDSARFLRLIDGNMYYTADIYDQAYDQRLDKFGRAIFNFQFAFLGSQHNYLSRLSSTTKSEAAEFKSCELDSILESSAIRILVLGRTGSGKSSVISRVMGDLVAKSSFDAGTAHGGTHESSDRFQSNGFLLDTPGIDDASASDADMVRKSAESFSHAARNEDKLNGTTYLFSAAKEAMRITPESGGNLQRNENPAAENSQCSDLETENLEKRLSSYHTSMIALGGAIGTGLFISGREMPNVTGPVAAQILYALTGCLIGYLTFNLSRQARVFSLINCIFCCIKVMWLLYICMKGFWLTPAAPTSAGRCHMDLDDYSSIRFSYIDLYRRMWITVKDGSSRATDPVCIGKMNTRDDGILDWIGGPSIYWTSQDGSLSEAAHVAVNEAWKPLPIFDLKIHPIQQSRLASVTWLYGASTWLYYQDIDNQLLEFGMDNGSRVLSGSGLKAESYNRPRLTSEIWINSTSSWIYYQDADNQLPELGSNNVSSLFWLRPPFKVLKAIMLDWGGINFVENSTKGVFSSRSRIDSGGSNLTFVGRSRVAGRRVSRSDGFVSHLFAWI